MHIHTTESDADRTVLEQLQLAKSKNLSSMWLTDHDMIRNIDRIREIQKQANDIDIVLGFGVEITVLWNKKEHHLLGYFPNHLWNGNDLSPAMKELQAACAIVKDSRKNRNTNLLAYLNEMLSSDQGTIFYNSPDLQEEFVPLELEVISEWARINADLFDKSSLGRPHFSKYLREVVGIRSDLIFGPRAGDGYGIVTNDNEVFWDDDATDKEGIQVEGLLHSGNLERRNIVFNPLPIIEAIHMINKAGGKAVVAHPPTLGNSWLTKFGPLFSDLKAEGLWGIESFSSEINNENHKAIHDIAIENQLYETGGSDNHGTLKPYAKLGNVYRNFSPDNFDKYPNIEIWEKNGEIISSKMRNDQEL